MEDIRQAEADASWQRVLEAFVVRARRVEEHSLASDWDALVALTTMQVTVDQLGDGQAVVRQVFPAEEVVESAAARIRPILLEGDPCFYQLALKALGWFCRELPQEAAWIRATRAEWRKRVSPSSPEEAGYWVAVSDTVTGQSYDLDRHRLAMAWIYGDVVHHDTNRRDEGDAFGLFERFRGAVPLVAWAMVGAIELLNFTRALHTDGVVQLRQEVLDEPVALKSTAWEHTARVYFAPVGAQAPKDASLPLPEDWVQLGRGVDLSVFRTDSGGQLPVRSTDMSELPSPEEVEAARTPAGGWKRDQLAAWGIPWPPPKGWKDELATQWRAAQATGAAPSGPAPGPGAGPVQEALDFG
ncbi:hypothetical protein [Streptomyces sp. bgisy091]|uniref:hypothetical protein n=1 Tax=Streptomyces sp. bgisy091 TaxID=3413778 RepID=UPI003D716F16